MNSLYKKNELLFSLIHIAVYVVGLSIADRVSSVIGTEKSVTAPIAALMSAVLFLWIRKKGLMKKYGLCKSEIPTGKMLFYLPLLLIISVNFFFGVKINLSFAETVLYIISMLCVGFIEEIIFRGFLFKAMAKDNLRSAIIVSSVTFGIGHIVNVINGSGADVLSTLLQIAYAIAAGFLFTVIFYRTKSLLPCIVTHSLMNALSVFADESALTVSREIFMAVALIAIPVLYIYYLCRFAGKKQ